MNRNRIKFGPQAQYISQRVSVFGESKSSERWEVSESSPNSGKAYVTQADDDNGLLKINNSNICIAFEKYVIRQIIS